MSFPARRACGWQALGGLAQMRAALDDPSTADALHAQAEDELTAKQMSAFAWLRAARGELATASGDHKTRLGALPSGAAAYSGYWLIESHVGALLRQEDRLDEAAAASAAVRAHGTSRAGPGPGTCTACAATIILRPAGMRSRGRTTMLR